VFGLEAQGDWADLKGSNVSNGFFLVPGDTVNQSRIDAIGLFTGQIGWAWNNALLYVKGGAAVTHDKYDGFVVGFAGDRASETRWGAAVGAGVEFGFAPNWSVGFEYDHLFMGDRDVTFTTLGALPVTSRTDRIGQDVDMATVRVNYRWGGPVIAKY
jgi:outer membrane immunogenic protein